MNVFMKVVLVVAVIAIIAGVVGGVITTNDRRNEHESLKLEREEMHEQNSENGNSEDREKLKSERNEQYKKGGIDRGDHSRGEGDYDRMGKDGKDMMGRDGMRGGRGFSQSGSDAESAKE